VRRTPSRLESRYLLNRLCSWEAGFESRYRGPESDSPISVRFDPRIFKASFAVCVRVLPSISVRSRAGCLTVSHLTSPSSSGRWHSCRFAPPFVGLQLHLTAVGSQLVPRWRRGLTEVPEPRPPLAPPRRLETIEDQCNACSVYPDVHQKKSDS
jgi:hypothetical protein